MGRTERRLRSECNIPDTLGFGVLRGILTGREDQSQEELPDLESMVKSKTISLADNVERCRRRLSYLEERWGWYNHQLTDPELDLDTANALLVKYVELVGELQKCKNEKESGERLLERWEDMLNNPDTDMMNKPEWMV